LRATVAVKRSFAYTLMAGFGLLALYAYLTLPSSSSSLLDQAEHVFFLDAGIGAVTIILYSLLRKADFFKLSSERTLVFDLRIPAAVVSGSLAVALIYVYRTVGHLFLTFPVPALLVFTVLALRGVYPFRGTTTTFAPLTEDRMVKFITGKDRLKGSPNTGRRVSPSFSPRREG